MACRKRLPSRERINGLEMWQADTFDPRRIDLELKWAQGLGMNTMRVFLHDPLWQQDAAGFRKRIDAFSANRGPAQDQTDARAV
jgi:endo-1,4-beta-mannosidase